MTKRRGPSQAERLATGSLAVLRPDFALLWDHERNGDLTPATVMNKSDRPVAWNCPEGPDHQFERSPAAMFGCPYCSNRQVSITNCLATKRPEMATLWHPTKNGDLTPSDVFASNAQVVWWVCGEGHAYEASLNQRTNRKVEWCPDCVRGKGSRTKSGNLTLASRFPNVAAIWHPTLNGPLTPDDVDCTDERIVWWLCPKDDRHAWEADIKRSARRVTPACPYCANRLALFEDSLAGKDPELATQWHPTKNGDLTPDRVPADAHVMVWWKCPEGPDHEWPAPVQRRHVKRSGCRCCVNRQLSVTNRLDLNFPAVVSQWHPTKNGTLTPDKVIAASHTMCWWLCGGCGNEWSATSERRTVLLTSCRDCNVYTTSKAETYLAHEMSAFVPVDLGRRTVRDLTGKAWQVDIVIPDMQVIVEYDGAFWHADREEKDREKTAALEGAGWTVLRVREKPLPFLQGVRCVAGQSGEAYQRSAAAALTYLVEHGYPVGSQEIAVYKRRNRLVRKDEARAAISARNDGRIRRLRGNAATIAA